ncbi:MAG: hypothetical protein ACK56K_06150 [Akkermansiaceae bacterium]|jgi:DNA-binding CsgD family transcriptional regulator|nr:hypothetical protein [Luteolibacter sp.]
MKKIISEKNVTPYWDDAKIALLGTMTDPELAKILGIKPHLVVYKRMALGIPALKDMSKRKWRNRDILLLGKKPDQEIADLLGFSKNTVTNQRKSLGIDAYAYKSKLWRIWTEEELALLGKHTDKEIARRLKLNAFNVSAKRHLLGIAPFRPKQPNKKPRPNAVKWTRRNLALLGKIPDEQLCEMMGICRKSVMKKRKELGIESYAVGTQFWHQCEVVPQNGASVLLKL